MRTKFEIDPDARAAVYERSGGICERCQEKLAVHVHHLTYKRAGREKPEDLQHICLGCHCAAHPYKADEILEWELQRRARLASGSTELETEEERQELEWEQEEEREEAEQEAQEALLAEHERQMREKAREEERLRNEPAWNLGKYVSSGYCLEDIEREEGRR